MALQLNDPSLLRQAALIDGAWISGDLPKVEEIGRAHV